MKIALPSVPLLAKLRPLWRYRLLLFVVFIAGLSAYLVIQINSAINVAATSEPKTSAKAKTPRIDPELVKQLQSLQDNSVTVQSLFNEARENPFTN